jgi:hypothetical protein
VSRIVDKLSVAYPWQRPYARAIFADPALMPARLYEAMAAIRRRLRSPIKGDEERALREAQKWIARLNVSKLTED